MARSIILRTSITSTVDSIILRNLYALKVSYLTLKLPGPAAGMGGSLTVTVA